MLSATQKIAARFVCLEGIDGAGKSYVTQRLLAYLQQQGIAAATTREPGGTPFADELAKLLLHFNERQHQEQLMPQTELLLFFAARCQHLHNFIIPNLDAGKWVISDRFIASSYAYQGYGRGLGWEQVAALQQYLPDTKPDLVILLDLAPKLLKERLRHHNRDRFEMLNDKALNFFSAVRQGYLRFAEQHPECVVIDASLSRAQVWAQVEQAIDSIIL